MDLSDTIAPKSDQLNADDLLAGPRDVTIAGVRRTTTDQPVAIDLEGIDRPWYPCKTVRRLLIACWGSDGSAWVGRRVRLYNDPAVQWAGQRVGGIRVSHLSDLDAPRTVLVSVKRGKRAPMTVAPLPPVERFDLLEVLARRGLSMAQLDEWADGSGRPLVSSLDAEGQERVARWLASSKADQVVTSLLG